MVVAGLSGDSGKTVVSLSLAAELRRRGLRLSVFKKGPDYIDAAWLTAIAGTACRNLDTWMVDPAEVRRRFVFHSRLSEVAVVEGNRGLFDGRDVEGSHSTAELAKLIAAPVILVVNAAKTTRTAAALVKGCLDFDPGVVIAGVVVNRVAGERHRAIVTAAIEKYCRIPVLGAIPRLGGGSGVIPGRHLGLVPPAEHGAGGRLTDGLAEIAGKHLDVDAILAAARSSGPLAAPEAASASARPGEVRVGYFRDSVFTFYYPENLEALEASGAEMVPVSSLDDAALPEVDALYIGGGFPETHAAGLARNSSMMKSVRTAAEAGMPIYAECGGLIYLAKSLTWHGETHPMAGVFPVDLMIHVMPVGHGYVTVVVDRPNPFFEVGTRIIGHEFHYSGPATEPPAEASCMRVDVGTGLGRNRDGLLHRNVLACYTHIHADGVKSWASRLVSSAKAYAENKVQER